MQQNELDRIMDRQYQSLLSKAAYLLHSYQDAEDALQNAYMKAWLKSGSLRSEASCLAWLNQIVYNECMSVLRFRKRQPLFLSEEQIQVMQSQQCEDELILDKHFLSFLLVALSEKQRHAFYTHYILGYDIANTARQLHLAEGTIKSQLHHARQALKRQFAYSNDGCHSTASSQP